MTKLLDWDTFIRHESNPYAHHTPTSTTLVRGLPSECNLKYLAYENYYAGNGAGAVLVENSARDNLLLGEWAGHDITTGDRNVCIGASSGDSITTGDENVFIGINAGYNTTINDSNNVGIGHNALSGIDGHYNIGIGEGAGYLIAGSNNIGIGFNACTGGVPVSFNYNIAMGYYSMANMTEGEYNIGIGGYAALINVEDGDDNIGLGQWSLDSVTSGNDNIGIGQNTLNDAISGDGNIAIGYNAGDKLKSSSTKNLCIGYDSGSPTYTIQNNVIYIHNSRTEIPLIGGDFGTGVGIFTAPASMTNILQVQEGSGTDPIADNWTTYPSNRSAKQILGIPQELSASLLSLPVYRYKRKPKVTRAEVQSEGIRRTDAIINGLGHSKKILFDNCKPEQFMDMQALRHELIAKKAVLPKYTDQRIGIMIDDPEVPDEILTHDDQGNRNGITLTGWLGWLTAVVKEIAEEVQELKRSA